MTEPTKEEGATFQRMGRIIGRNDILARYWELATIEPTATKDTLAGQLKALDSLCEHLNLRPAGKEPAEAPNIYRAAWLANPSGEV